MAIELILKMGGGGSLLQMETIKAISFLCLNENIVILPFK